QQLNDEETKKICIETISKLSATSIKDMGKVMSELKNQYSDNLDFAKAGPILKGLLNK
ncbi:GatB/YqeY domain-containing protein, partial [Candidatus Pelagibacter sp.]|nr:GatB/YqeY domain-containing protein [Candidatus Pelagibacter sp.]